MREILQISQDYFKKSDMERGEIVHQLFVECVEVIDTEHISSEQVEKIILSRIKHFESTELFEVCEVYKQVLELIKKRYGL